MNETLLVVVGNGFDRHHSIPSCYGNFKQFVRSRNPVLFEKVEEYLPVDANWSDLERALGELDAQAIAEEFSMYLQAYGAEDWSDSGHGDYQFELQNLTDALTAVLKSEFQSWVTRLPIPDRQNVSKLLLPLDCSARYFTFNYTDTLQTLYGIAASNVLHVHGAVNSSSDEIVLGHAWRPPKKSEEQMAHESNTIDQRIIEGEAVLNSYFSATFKDTSTIIKENEKFFSALSNVTDVLVLGHSLADVDMPYFKKLASCVTANSSWRVTFHDEGEVSGHKAKINKLGVKSCSFLKMTEVT